MRWQTFVAVMALYAALAFCCLQETSRQTRTRYRLGRAQRLEEEQRRIIDALRADELRLQRTVRLVRMNQNPALRLTPLRPWNDAAVRRAVPAEWPEAAP